MTTVDVGSDSDAPFSVLVALMGAKKLTIGTGRLCWNCRRGSPSFCWLWLGFGISFKRSGPLPANPLGVGVSFGGFCRASLLLCWTERSWAFEAECSRSNEGEYGSSRYHTAAGRQPSSSLLPLCIVHCLESSGRFPFSFIEELQSLMMFLNPSRSRFGVCHQKWTYETLLHSSLWAHSPFLFIWAVRPRTLMHLWKQKHSLLVPKV
jgi:hypothetical protein